MMLYICISKFYCFFSSRLVSAAQPSALHGDVSYTASSTQAELISPISLSSRSEVVVATAVLSPFRTVHGTVCQMHSKSTPGQLHKSAMNELVFIDSEFVTGSIT